MSKVFVMNPRGRRRHKKRRARSRKNCGAACARINPSRRRRKTRSRRRRNPFALRRNPHRRHRRRRNPFGFKLPGTSGLVKNLIAGVAGFYATKAVGILALRKPIDGFTTDASGGATAWREPLFNAASAAAAFAIAAIGKMTHLAKGDAGTSLLMGGLLFAVNRGIEKSAIVSGMGAGFTKDLLSDYVFADGGDNWDGDLGHVGHQGNVLECTSLGDFEGDEMGEFDELSDYEFEGD